MKNEFIESKKLKLWMVQVFLIITLGLSVYALLFQLFTQSSFGNRDIPSWLFGIGIFILLGLIASFVNLKLETEINNEGIKVKFGILAQESWAWADIKKTSLVKHSFLGLGKRKNAQYGTVLSTGGRQGLAVELKNGQKWLINIQDTEELSKLLKVLKK
jgi:hypothetical protein